MVTINYDNIRAEMARKKISGVEIAKKLNLSQNSFYKKINGKRNFTALELGILANILDTEINFFYN